MQKNGISLPKIETVKETTTPKATTHSNVVDSKNKVKNFQEWEKAEEEALNILQSIIDKRKNQDTMLQMSADQDLSIQEYYDLLDDLDKISNILN
jgi:hypothetical protein